MRPPVSGNPPARTVGPVTRTDIVRFAGAGGDFNPLHHDHEFAVAAGYPDVIAMGQLQAGMLAGWLTDWCGVEHLRELAVRFVAPVRPGDTLTFAGRVTAHHEDGSADLELTATTQRGLVVRATAVALLAETPAP